MDSDKRRDPLTLLIQSLTMLGVAWVGFGISQLEAPSGIGVPGEDPELQAQIHRTLQSLEEVLSALAKQPPGRISTPPNDPAEASRNQSAQSRKPIVDASLRAELDEIRTHLARQSRANRSGIVTNPLTRGVSLTGLASAVRRTHKRLQSPAPGEADLARQELMLADYRTVLLKYGKPHRISINKGIETWSYKEGDAYTLRIRFHGGLVTTAY